MNGRLLGALALGLLVALGAAWLLFGRGERAGGPRVATENPCELFPSLDGGLTSWMQEWRRLEPALTCEHFERVAEETPPVTTAQPWADASGLLARAPRRWKDATGRRLLVPREEPGEVALVDLDAGLRRVVVRSETGGWRDAAWMDETGFVAAGESKRSTSGTIVPVLTVVRLDSNRATRYEGPAVAESRVDELARPARR